MKIHSAEFLISNTDIGKCPPPNFPEYAFIGRSNVGKSSLINKLTDRKKLAKTSGTPGKTQLINHFIINKKWYLVDLPGYGYAKSSRKNRNTWQKFIEKYLLERANLMNLFVLIDSRLPPQKKDLQFMEWCAVHIVPFTMIFTKTDKLNANKLQQNIQHYKKLMQKDWVELPPYFLSSAVSGEGSKEILAYIEKINSDFHEELG